MPPTTASRTFQVSRATLYRWLENPNPKPLPKTRTRKLDPQKLLDHVRRYPDARLRDRAAEFGVYPSAISYRLKQLKVTRKKNSFAIDNAARVSVSTTSVSYEL